MKVYSIWVQRKCQYPGQWAPELYEAISEYVNEDNPDWYKKKLAEASKQVGSEFTAVREITMEVSDSDLATVFGEVTIETSITEVK